MAQSRLVREDALIAASVGPLEDTLAAIMDQMLSSYERTRQLTLPEQEATNQLIDAMNIGWAAGIGFGVSEFVAQKQDTSLGIRALTGYMREHGAARARLVGRTTIRQITDQIVRGQRQGLTPVQIAKDLLNRVPAMALTRAKIIAATEIHSAIQFGAYQAALASGKTLIKIWNTVEDDRVRDFGSAPGFSHRAMQGTSVALERGFSVPHSNGTFESLLYPGDPAGSPGNIINCRCFVTYKEV